MSTTNTTTISVQVSCITKRGDHYNPHERILGLGGVHGGKQWWMKEDAIIDELTKNPSARQWNFYVSVDGKTVWIVVAAHNERLYLKTEADGYAPNNLLNLPECP